MSAKYIYSKAADFPLGLTRSKLVEEVAASLSVPLENGRIDISGENLDVVELYFADVLSVEDKTLLDDDSSPAGGVIGAHQSETYDVLPKKHEVGEEEEIVSTSGEVVGEVTLTLRKGSYVLIWGVSIKGSHKNRKVIIELFQEDQIIKQFKLGVDDWLPVENRVFISVSSSGETTFKLNAYCDQPKSMVTVSDVFFEVRED